MAIYRTAVNIYHPSVTGPAVNVWHLRTDGPIEESTADSVMTAIKQFYVDASSAVAGDTVFRWLGEMTTVEAEPNTVTPGTAWEVTAGGTDYACPGAISMLVKWQAATGGRSGKGKTFVGPVGLSHVTTYGRPSGGILTDLQNAATALVDTSGGDNGWAVGVWSRQDQTLRDIVGSSVYGKFAVLRSRRD